MQHTSKLSTVYEYMNLYIYTSIPYHKWGLSWTIQYADRFFQILQTMQSYQSIQT